MNEREELIEKIEKARKTLGWTPEQMKEDHFGLLAMTTNHLKRVERAHALAVARRGRDK